MFEIYVISCCYHDNSCFYRRQISSFDLAELLKPIESYDSWKIEKCEIIEGLYYTIKLIARSSNVYKVS